MLCGASLTTEHYRRLYQNRINRPVATCAGDFQDPIGRRELKIEGPEKSKKQTHGKTARTDPRRPEGRLAKTKKMTTKARGGPLY